MKICMFLLNPITNDGRVKREARYLAEAGHDLTIIGEHRDGYALEEMWEGVRFLRVPEFGPFVHKVAKTVRWRSRLRGLIRLARRLKGADGSPPVQASAPAPLPAGASGPFASPRAKTGVDLLSATNDAIAQLPMNDVSGAPFVGLGLN